MTRLRRAVADLVTGLVLGIPGRLGSELRVHLYRARGARIGQRVRIDPGASIDEPQLVDLGDDVWIDRFSIIIAGPPRPGRETRIVGPERPELVGRVRIGPRCHIGAHVVLSGIGGLGIGEDVTLSAGTKVYSLSHHYRSWGRPSNRSVAFGSQVPVERQSMLQGSVILGANVGVGADSLILPGTEIGPESFVRPHSVVSGQWPANSLLGGHPAQREGDRFPPPNGDGE